MNRLLRGLLAVATQTALYLATLASAHPLDIAAGVVIAVVVLTISRPLLAATATSPAPTQPSGWRRLLAAPGFAQQGYPSKPVRMVVPWKYGFKSGKSIVRIRFVEKQPVTSWNRAAPQEYGFYSNVNPEVDHPRWSQATERRIGDDGFLARKRATLMFNGYADQVAGLYAGMDLKRSI